MKQYILGGIILFLIIGCYCSCSTIGAGEVGIPTLFGKPNQEILSSGIHFINPLASIHKMDVRVQTLSSQSEAASSDLQIVDTTLTLNYQVDYKNALTLYVQIGGDPEYIKNSIVAPYINETFKSVVAHFTAEELINKRDIVSHEILNLLQKKLHDSYMNVTSVSITNFQFSKSFNEAIEKKVTAQQQVLTSQNNLARQKVENEIAITKAQTDAQAVVLRAEADAKALNLKKSAVTEEMIQLNAIEKWNGVLPIYTSSVPFIKTLEKGSK